MAGGLGGGGVPIELLEDLYAMDEDNHAYHIIKVCSSEEAKKYRKKMKADRNRTVFVEDATKPRFRTVRLRNGRKQVVIMNRRMNAEPSGKGVRHKSKQKRIFSDDRLMDVDARGD